MRRIIARYALTLLAVAVAAAGCRRIPLYDLSTEIRIVIDHQLGIDHEIKLSADTDLPKDYQDKITGKMPQYVNVLFYNPDTHKLVTSQILGAEGGLVSIPAGEYDIVVYNFGTESTQTRTSDHRMKAEAHTSDITNTMYEKMNAIQTNGRKENKAASKTDSKTDSKTYSKGYGDDPVIHEPDHLYVANETGIEIPAFIEQKEDVTIYMTSSTILDTYSLEVLNIKGAENIEKVEAFITGQIKSNWFGRPERNTKAATIYTDMRTDVPGKRLYTIFNTFGKLPGEQNEVYLDITVTDSGGGQYRYIYDITDQFDDPDNTTHTLVVEGNEIDIPEAALGGGGFAPSVDEWEDEIIGVPLG